MVYRRRYRKRKYVRRNIRSKRRVYKRRRSTYGKSAKALAMRALRAVRALKRQKEMKYLLKSPWVAGLNSFTHVDDLTIDALGMANKTGSGIPDFNAVCDPLSAGLLQGTGGGTTAAGSLIGNKLYVKRMSIRFKVTQALLAPDRTNVLTLLIIKDTNPFLAGVFQPAPTLGDIYKDLGAGLAADQDPKLAFNNEKMCGNHRRFKVMRKVTRTVSSTTDLAKSEGYGRIDISNFALTWDQASRQLVGYKIWILAFSDSFIAPHPLLTFNVQTMFTDD